MRSESENLSKETWPSKSVILLTLLSLLYTATETNFSLVTLFKTVTVCAVVKKLKKIKNIEANFTCRKVALKSITNWVF